MCQIVRNRPQDDFLRQKKWNQHPILDPCVKFDLNLLRNKKGTENLIFDGSNELKFEMTSYSDSAYDVTKFFVVLKVPGLYSIPTKFHSCQTPNCRVKLGGLPPSIIGVSRTLSKIGLKWGWIKTEIARRGRES